MKHLNIEIKARSDDHAHVRSILESKNADFRGVDHQIDTYFSVNFGRLKLREGNIENHLIHYTRENIAGPKQSNITLFRSDPGSSLKDILVKSCGVLTIVDKKREIYYVDNVKFHIDIVESLGTFVEIEAIDSDSSMGKEKLLAQCQSYMKLLNIDQNDLIDVSYSDLLLQKI